jgi:hypothetical protein
MKKNPNTQQRRALVLVSTDLARVTGGITSPRDVASGLATGVISPRDAASGLPTG